MLERLASEAQFVLSDRLRRVYRRALALDRTAVLMKLTAREREVVPLLARGLTNAELGEMLSISPETAKWHVKNILHKLGLRSRVELDALV